MTRSVWHLATNSLAGRPGRTALLVIAVSLATVLSVLVACAIATLQNSYKQSMAAAAGASDMSIRHRSYGRFDGKVLDLVRSWPEVDVAAARLDHKGLTVELARTQQKSPALMHGVEPELEHLFFPVRMLEGRWIQADGEAVIDGRLKAALQAQVGDELTIEWQTIKLKVVGVIQQPPLTVMQAPGLRTTLKTVQTLSGYPGKVRKIDIRVKEGIEIPAGLQREGEAPAEPPGEGEAPAEPPGEGEAPAKPQATPGAPGSPRFGRSLTLPTDEPRRKPTVGDVLIHRYRDALAAADPQALFEPPANVRSGINRGVKWTNLVSQIVTVLVCLSTAFIIVTGLTTAVAERTRELAIMRCIGTPRLTIAVAQVLAGGVIAAIGAAIGAPLGVLGAYALYEYNREVLTSGFLLDGRQIAIAIGSTILAGLLGALYPAILASRVKPLEALAARAVQPRTMGVIVCLVLGLCALLFQPAMLAILDDTEQAFWIYLPYGLGITFFGYCILCVPVLVLIARPATTLLSRVLKLPGVLLYETVMATPFRHGLTGGALMMGLALLISIWTEGGNLLYGWFDMIKMPDAFVMTAEGFTPPLVEQIRSTPGVTRVSAVRAIPVLRRDVHFGVKGISPPFTLYAAADVEQFLDMTDVDWLDGNKEVALKRLAKGGAVLVGREYFVAHKLGVGSKVTLRSTAQQRDVEFEIAGVVSAKGLDVAVQHYGIGMEYAEASISTVFGTREDGLKYFDIERPDLILMSIAKDSDAEELLKELKTALASKVGGDLRADTSRSIKKEIHSLSLRLMRVASSLALSSLLIASFGVANLIVAEIHARRFEYGVLRAIGGQRGMLGRLIAGQTLVIAAVACLVGCGLGMQVAVVAKVFHQRLVGITYSWNIPWSVLVWGSLIVAGMALAAAFPAMWRLMRRQPTTLLAADA